MDTDISFFLNESNLRNLRTLSFKKGENFQLNICEIAEIADSCSTFAKLLSESGLGIYEILSLIADNAFDAFAYKSEAPDILLNSTKAFFEMSGIAERAVFSRLLAEKIIKAGIALDENAFLNSPEKPETFTYVKNSLADEAFDVFSQSFSDPRVKYSPTFKDAVNAVIREDVSYCLLPIEERFGARLSTVSELIFSKDLKIVSITPVFGPDGTADIKYALISTAYSVPEYNKIDDRYLELKIMSDNNSASIHELLAVADIYGLTPHRINMVAQNTDDGVMTQYSLVLCGVGADFTEMLTYLTLFSSGYTTIGIYANID